MKIALTGATGFVGRYLVRQLAGSGHSLRCWHRPSSDLTGLESQPVEWHLGDLNDPAASKQLVAGCDAVIHAALARPCKGFRGAEGDVVEFAQRNVIGSLRLIEAARLAGVSRFIFISTCAVHEKILGDRPLDETHPVWPTSHYGAHKAAIEKFVHSYGLGMGFPICALRPTGVYGVAHPPQDSKWFDLVEAVVQGRDVICQRGGKEVHAADVARAAEVLLMADANQIAGETFNCYDRYVSEWDVAHLAKKLSGSGARIQGLQASPKNEIVTNKIRSLGMEFGGDELLKDTVATLVEAAKSTGG